MRLAAVALIGVSGGGVIGLALVAFLTALGVITRLSQLTATGWALSWYGWVVAAGAGGASLLLVSETEFGWPAVLVVPTGLAMGIFVGMVAGALAEVINVMPVVGGRFQLGPFLRWLVLALAAGKLAGALVYWLTGVFP